jgi:hypothetical protein
MLPPFSSLSNPSGVTTRPTGRHEVKACSTLARENPNTISVVGGTAGYPRNQAEFVLLIGIGRPYLGPKISTAPCSP